jgi:hypothetical protein
MGSYLWNWPPSYKVDLPIDRVRWEADDQRVMIRIEEFPDDSRGLIYRRQFDSWWAKAINNLLNQPLQIMGRYLEVILLAAALIIGWLFFRV